MHPCSTGGWYFDAASYSDPGDLFVITLFTSSATTFPFLDPSESSIFIAYLSVSFTNGTVSIEHNSASVATFVGGDSAKPPSAGNCFPTEFSWTALTKDLSEYEIVIASDKIQVEGRFASNSVGPVRSSPKDLC